MSIEYSIPPNRMVGNGSKKEYPLHYDVYILHGSLHDNMITKEQRPIQQASNASNANERLKESESTTTNMSVGRWTWLDGW